jgi:hypothetical protein
MPTVLALALTPLAAVVTVVIAINATAIVLDVAHFARRTISRGTGASAAIFLAVAQQLERAYMLHGVPPQEAAIAMNMMTILGSALFAGILFGQQTKYFDDANLLIVFCFFALACIGPLCESVTPVAIMTAWAPALAATAAVAVRNSVQMFAGNYLRLAACVVFLYWLITLFVIATKITSTTTPAQMDAAREDARQAAASPRRPRAK